MGIDPTLAIERAKARSKSRDRSASTSRGRSEARGAMLGKRSRSKSDLSSTPSKGMSSPKVRNHACYQTVVHLERSYIHFSSFSSLFFHSNKRQRKNLREMPKRFAIGMQEQEKETERSGPRCPNIYSLEREVLERQIVDEANHRANHRSLLQIFLCFCFFLFREFCEKICPLLRVELKIPKKTYSNLFSFIFLSFSDFHKNNNIIMGISFSLCSSSSSSFFLKHRRCAKDTLLSFISYLISFFLRSSLLTRSLSFSLIPTR